MPSMILLYTSLLRRGVLHYCILLHKKSMTLTKPARKKQIQGGERNGGGGRETPEREKRKEEKIFPKYFHYRARHVL